MLFSCLTPVVLSGDRPPAFVCLFPTALPLENLSGDPNQDYFSDGMTDELITDPARLPGVRVISRTSTVHYKRTNKQCRRSPTD